MARALEMKKIAKRKTCPKAEALRIPFRNDSAPGLTPTFFGTFPVLAYPYVLNFLRSLCSVHALVFLYLLWLGRSIEHYLSYSIFVLHIPSPYSPFLALSS